LPPGSSENRSRNGAGNEGCQPLRFDAGRTEAALLRAADFCDSCIHETAKRQPGHWYGLAFEPVLKGTRV